MPLPTGKYVRYWDGRAEAYGVITAVKQASYSIRVGGTDTIIDVPHHRVALHTAVVASGIGLDPKTYGRVQVGDKYLYHATSYDLLPNIVSWQGLAPRSRVNWSSVDKDAWTGTEKAAKRIGAVEVRTSSYFAELESSAQKGTITNTTLLGDVGEFFYAAKRHDDALINYIHAIFNGGKSPVVARFKAPSIAWYQDPKSTGAVMTMNPIPLVRMEMKFIPSRYKELSAEIELTDFLLDPGTWYPCIGTDWLETIEVEKMLDF